MRSIQARIFRHRPVAKLLLTAALGALPLAGCAVDDGAALNEDDLTNVANTAVKRQSIGNCWVYRWWPAARPRRPRVPPS